MSLEIREELSEGWAFDSQGVLPHMLEVVSISETGYMLQKMRKSTAEFKHVADWKTLLTQC